MVADDLLEYCHPADSMKHPVEEEHLDTMNSMKHTGDNISIKQGNNVMETVTVQPTIPQSIKYDDNSDALFVQAQRNFRVKDIPYDGETTRFTQQTIQNQNKRLIREAL
mmetsp:Transcript_19129/g.29318  ORF Transcript_19129/g.29318 Transcript_19129/m.29318 type:complete len:109 (+) Transcript_19129:377-703(+)